MSETFLPNSNISHYRIVSRIGAGGMGEVYLAEDIELERQVALKVLLPEVAADEDRLRRFVQEAKAASALNHPNILTVHEIGSFENSRFIATELIRGETLRDRLKGERFTLRETMDVALQIAAALNAAHAAGIVHRDIKPENIMLRDDGLVKVLDFGLAKLTNSELAPGSETDEAAKTRHQTRPGLAMGTVYYMSPEQTRGLPIDSRSDVWSLGVVLYEMLTRRPPFAAETVNDSIAAILTREPAPLNEDLPKELQRITRKSLQKRKDERYQTVKDFQLDLQNLKRELEFSEELERSQIPSFMKSSNASSNQPSENATVIQPRAASTQNDLRQPPSSGAYIDQIKNHKGTVAIALAVLLLAAIGVGYWFTAHRARSATDTAPIESIAVLPFQSKSTDSDTEYLSEGLAESLIYRLSQLPNLRVSPTSMVFRYKEKPADAVRVGNELGVSAVLLGRITQRGDNLTISAELVDVRYNKLLWGEQYDRKMSDLLATQREIAREIVENLKLKVSGEEKGLAKHYTENNEAYQLYLRGRFYWNKRTEGGMQKSLEYFQQAIEKDPSFALAYSGLADAYDLLGAQDAAGGMAPNEAFPKAKAAALKALEIDDTLAEPHVSLAHIKYYYDRDLEVAEREYRRAIELNPNYPIAHQWYAIFLMSVGRFDEALTQARRAQELDPLSLPINMTVGWVLLNARQYHQSVEQSRKTLEMDPNFILAHHRLGLAYEQQGKYDEAIAEFKQVVSLLPGKPLGIASLAHAYALSGKRAEAQANLNELQEISKQRYVSPASIAMTYAALGDNDLAFAWLDKADKAHDALLARLKVDPRFDSLRSDPRFADLAKRVGLPQ